MAYWIQLELDPSGHKTGCVQFDLERISRLQANRENRAIVQVAFRYDSENVSIHGKAAGRLHDLYSRFIEQHAGGFSYQDPEAAPGTILVAKKGGLPSAPDLLRV